LRTVGIRGVIPEVHLPQWPWWRPFAVEPKSQKSICNSHHTSEGLKLKWAVWGFAGHCQ